MKHNLKNRPKIEDVWKNELSGTEDGYNSEAASIAGKMEEWFEGFKKELRQILEECKTTDKYDYDNETYESCVREILGENDQT